MGKWYASEGKAQYGVNSSFQAIAVPHKRIHDNVSKVMSHFSGGNSVSHSEDIIELFKSTEDSSTELFEHLDSMIKS